MRRDIFAFASRIPYLVDIKCCYTAFCGASPSSPGSCERVGKRSGSAGPQVGQRVQVFGSSQAYSPRPSWGSVSAVPDLPPAGSCCGGVEGGECQLRQRGWRGGGGGNVHDRVHAEDRDGRVGTVAHRPPCRSQQVVNLSLARVQHSAVLTLRSPSPSRSQLPRPPQPARFSSCSPRCQLRQRPRRCPGEPHTTD